MRKELAEYSDFALHSFAAAHGKAFAKFLLPAQRVHDAAKCRFLARLLPELKASLFACCFIPHLRMKSTFAWFISHLRLKSTCAMSTCNLTKYALQRELNSRYGFHANVSLYSETVSRVHVTNFWPIRPALV